MTETQGQHLKPLEMKNNTNSTQSLPHTEEKGLLQRTNPSSLLLFNNTVKVLADTIKKKKLKASTL